MASTTADDDFSSILPSLRCLRYLKTTPVSEDAATVTRTASCLLPVVVTGSVLGYHSTTATKPAAKPTKYPLLHSKLNSILCSQRQSMPCAAFRFLDSDRRWRARLSMTAELGRRGVPDWQRCHPSPSPPSPTSCSHHADNFPCYTVSF